MASDRNELFDVLQRISELDPDVRMGQLIENTYHFFCSAESPSLYDLEDADLLAGLQKHLGNLENRRESDRNTAAAIA
jgi:hypothetical protein